MKNFDKIKKHAKTIWKDPVWSKVISAGIIFILSVLGMFIKSIYQKIPFKDVFFQFVDFLKANSSVNNALIIITGVLLLAFTISFICRLRKNISKRRIVTDEREKPEIKELPKLLESTTLFFSDRLAKAFPGQRGLEWYDSKQAVKRLKVFFQDPLTFDVGNDCTSKPIWWFRAGSSASIDKFQTLSKTKILLRSEELKIKRMAVNVDSLYYKSYIYVEAKAEKPIGLYSYTNEDISRQVQIYGHSNEEYGLLNNRPITRNQYDDGAAIVKGKVVDAGEAELRVRHLSDYNFIICAQEAPYNSDKFTQESGEIFNKILQNTADCSSLFTFLNTFTKNEHLRRYDIP